MHLFIASAQKLRKDIQAVKYKHKAINKLRHGKLHKVVDLINADVTGKSKDNEGIINKIKNSPARGKAKLLRKYFSH